MITNFKSVKKDYNDLVEIIKKNYDVTLDSKVVKELAPIPHYYCSFELKNSSTEVANAIRRILIDEYPINHMTCSFESIKTDDMVLASQIELIQRKIQLISIEDLPQSTTTTFKLECKNDTQEKIIVMSSMIKGDKDIKFSKNVRLCELSPGKIIKIDKIILEWGRNYELASFAKFGPIEYKQLEYKEPNLPQSATVMVKDYHIGFECYEFFDPKKVMNKVLQVLINRLNNCKKRLEDYKKNQIIPYENDELKVIQAIHSLKIYFKKETATISHLIRYFTYMSDEDIDCIYVSNDHIEDKSTIININHDNPIKILIVGIDSAVKHITKLMKDI